MKNKPLTMVVDGSNLAYRSYFKFRNIHTPSQGHLGLVYGFLRILYSYLVRFKPHKLVISFDTKHCKDTNFRNSYLENYKVLRAIKNNLDFDYESFNKQIRILKRILTTLGVSVIFDEKGLGHETDDYIAYIVLNNPSEKFLIISSDKDFYQLVNRDIKMFNPAKEEIIALYNGEKIYEYPPEIYKEFLILTGDKSDGIPGYKGVGPVKAKQFFEKFGSIENYLSSSEEFPYVTKEGMDFLYKRNRILIDLKYGLKEFPISEIPLINKPFNYEKSFKLLDKYSMSSFLKSDFTNTFKNLKQWINE